MYNVPFSIRCFNYPNLCIILVEVQIMKKFFSLIMILIFILSPMYIFAEEALEINDNLVNAKLLENGDLRIIEDIAYSFNDDFNGVIRDINLSKIDNIKNVSVSELINENEVDYIFNLNAENGDSKVFHYYVEGDYFNIKIFSPSEDEVKTFRLRYTIANAAKRHEDISELNYKFIGESNQIPIKDFMAIIDLPNFDSDVIKIFGHGPSNGDIYFTDDNLIQLTVQDVPPDTFVEARVLFPLDYIPLSTNNGDKNLDDILSEKQQYAKDIEEKNIRRENNKRLFNKISSIFSFIGALILLFVYKITRRDPYISDYLKEATLDEISPAELNFFMNSVINARGLMSTIFDLSRREYIKIDEVNNEKDINIDDREFLLIDNRKMDTDLLEHEQLLMEWLFENIGNGLSVSTDDIEHARKKSLSFNKYYSGWMKQVSKDIESRDYYDENGKRYGSIILLLSTIMFILGVITLVYEGLFGIGVVILGIIIFIIGIVWMTRKSDKGYIQYMLWKDIKKETEKYSHINIDIPRDKTMIYAYALGLSMEKLDEHRRSYGNNYFPLYWGSWYFHHYNKQGGSLLEDKFNKSFYGNSANSSPNSTGLGGGGGFTGGGGGGIGGGGSRGF